VTVTNAPVTGIRNPDQPDRWLVRPWPVGAHLCDVVRHFLNAYVWGLRSETDSAHHLAYYKGYLAAIEAAPQDGMMPVTGWDWYEDLCVSIGRCVSVQQQKHAAESATRRRHTLLSRGAM
jgi:hypothetical protein